MYIYTYVYRHRAKQVSHITSGFKNMATWTLWESIFRQQDVWLCPRPAMLTRTLPTLQPRVDKHHLLWAIWSPRYIWCQLEESWVGRGGKTREVFMCVME